MLRIDSAIQATTQYRTRETVPGREPGRPGKPVGWKLRTTVRDTVIYDLSFEDALTTGGVITPDFWDSGAAVTFSKASVTIQGHRDAEIKVTITAPTDPNLGQ